MVALDWITLRGLAATGFHGVYPDERRCGQRFVVDVRLGLPLETGTDDLGDTVDYSVVARDVVGIITGEPVDLVETLAGRIADRCLAEPLVRRAEVTVHKPQAPMDLEFGDVSVTITRDRSTSVADAEPAAAAARPPRTEQPPEECRVVFSLGSNQGNSLALLQAAIDALLATEGVTPVALSGVYRTAPVGPVAGQPDFLNIVLVATTTLEARVLLERCHAVEDAAGRVRTVVGGPRTLDVDLVVVGDLMMDTDDLVLPHPRAHERAFVLAPWLEADPAAEIPRRGRVADLLAGVGREGVHRTQERVVLR